MPLVFHRHSTMELEMRDSAWRSLNSAEYSCRNSNESLYSFIVNLMLNYPMMDTPIPALRRFMQARIEWETRRRCWPRRSRNISQFLSSVGAKTCKQLRAGCVAILLAWSAAARGSAFRLRRKLVASSLLAGRQRRSRTGKRTPWPARQPPPPLING